MKIEQTKFLSSVSYALDYVEGELLGAAINAAEGSMEQTAASGDVRIQKLMVAPNHAKRVAVLTNKMASALGMDDDAVYALTHAALLHDSALSEYLSDEFTGEKARAGVFDLKPHCVAGERIISDLPFYDKIKNSVLYHHERADGRGPFGKTGDLVPDGAQLIHLADVLDTAFNLDRMDEEKYNCVIEFVKSQKGRLYTERSADAFLRSADYELLCSITGDGSRTVVESLIPNQEADISTKQLRKLSGIFAEITDYKSHFTWRHSLGIAEKAEKMGEFYGYAAEERDKLYIAGALHDIGKLFIKNGILEKPGKLTGDEYREIQNHALGTLRLLEGIGGMEDITSWAANHHEKLDGSGYPFGKKAPELSHHDRLLACLDIYQALVEERPYKPGLSHAEAMKILNDMGGKGQLDENILRDIDSCFGSGEATVITPKVREQKQSYSGPVWRCPVCGYIYEGELPADFICPQCEQPGSIFEKTME